MDGFEILEKLGEGAYSVVYKVKRKEDSNIYALKKVKLRGLTEKEKQNALNEVRILASVKSPFVISYKEAFIEEESETLCIVMEYADKGDLYQKIVQLKKYASLIDAYRRKNYDVLSEFGLPTAPGPNGWVTTLYLSSPDQCRLSVILKYLYFTLTQFFNNFNKILIFISI